MVKFACRNDHSGYYSLSPLPSPVSNRSSDPVLKDRWPSRDQILKFRTERWSLWKIM